MPPPVQSAEALAKFISKGVKWLFYCLFADYPCSFACIDIELMIFTKDQ